MIYELAQKCRAIGDDIESALLTQDVSTVKLRAKEQAGVLQELADFGCENLAFWLRQEQVYLIQVMKYARRSRVSIEEAQRTWRHLKQATERVDEILGVI